jgi:DNA mismatch repair protein MutL
VAGAVRSALEKSGHRPVAVVLGAPQPAVKYAPVSELPPLVQEKFIESPRPAEEAAESEINPSTSLSVFENQKSEIRAVHGIVGQLYILAENEGGLVIVDQHAAHERVLYERVLRQISAPAAPSQKLLMPQNVELPAADAVALREHLPLLERMGFGISEFGKGSFIVDALPPHLEPVRLGSLFREIVDALREAGRGVNRDRFREEAVAKRVCRAAVKARDPLKPKEAEALVRDLLACSQPYCCPHGRPTMIQVTHQELERKFGRRD